MTREILEQLHRHTAYIIIAFLLALLSEFSLSGQEVLRPSKIQARGVRKNLPELGLPLRNSGDIDPMVWYKDGCWRGADSLKASPFWVTETIEAESVVKSDIPSRIVDFCKEWATEKPDGPVHVVTGPVEACSSLLCVQDPQAASNGNQSALLFQDPEWSRIRLYGSTAAA